MMFFPIQVINLNLIQVKGRSDLFLRLEVLKRLIGLGILCTTVPLGVLAMCYGIVFSSLISLFLNTYYTGKFIKLGLLLQLKDILPILINSIVAGGFAFLVVVIIKNDLISLIVACFLATAYYLGSSYLFKFTELHEIINILRRKSS